MTAITWFEANYMKLNEDKCHSLFDGTAESMFSEVGDEKYGLSEKV